jgi:hypothetical protein
MIGRTYEGSAFDPRFGHILRRKCVVVSMMSWIRRPEIRLVAVRSAEVPKIRPVEARPLRSKSDLLRSDLLRCVPR